MVCALMWCAFVVGAQSAHAGAVRTDPAFVATVLPRNDDGSSPAVPLGFTANFFGTTYDNVFVNNNGDITFTGPYSAFTPSNLNTIQNVIIAGFFADIDTRGTTNNAQPTRYGRGTVNGRPAFGASYINVGYFSSHTDKQNSLQIILIDRSDTGAGNFDIELNYDKIQFESGDATAGSRNGLGGVTARVGFSNGTRRPGTFFEFPGSGIAGAFLDSNRNTGLIYGSFNSGMAGRYIFEVRGGVVGGRLSVSDAQVIEGNSGTTDATFTVTLTPPAVTDVTVDYATSDNTATAGSDYVATSGTLTFAAGESTKTFTVPVIGDLLREGDETFFVNLSNTQGGSFSRQQGVGTIFDEESNTPPVATDIERRISEDTALNFPLGFFNSGYTDADGDPLRAVRIESLPTSGTLRLNGTAVTAGQTIQNSDLSGLTYTPNANFFGNDSFGYSDFDRIAYSNVAAVNIIVNSVNDLPTISNIANVRINRNTSTGPLNFRIGDVETPFSGLVLSATSSNPSLVPVANIVFANPIDDDDDDTTDQRTVTVTPAAGQIGVATITLTVTDADGGRASTSFVVTVNGAPVLADSSYTIPNGRVFFAQLQASDPNNDSLTYQIASGALPDGLSLSSAGLIAGTPTRTGSFTATVRVSDGLDQTTARVFFTVVAAPVNRAPVVDNQTLSASLNRPFSIPLAASDPDGDSLYFLMVAGSALPPQLTLSQGGMLSGVATRTGAFYFSVVVSDRRGGTTRANYLLIVTNAADGQGPIITRSELPSVATRAQLATATLNGTVRDVAPDGVTPSGVNRMLFQLRRVSDGFAFDGSAFTPNINLGYLPIPVSAATGNPAATRNWNYALSSLPSASVLTPGRYSLSILAQDNAGNYGITVIYITVPSGSSNPSAGNG